MDTSISTPCSLSSESLTGSSTATCSIELPSDHQADQLTSPQNDEVVISSAGGHRSTRLTSYCKRHYCPDQATFKSSSRAFCGFIQSLFPIIHWLPNYDLRANLLSDLVTGVTILALHIPQGLAYGRLAGVEPIYGLYVSLFPVIIYSLMGTSRQISIGTFAVVSMGCRDVLNNFKIPLDGTVTAGMDSNGTVYLETEMLQFGGQKLRPIDVLTSLALLIGLFQFLVGSFRLGFLAILLSDSVVSSFVVASSMHVFSSQVFALIGIDSTPRNTDLSIPFELVKLWARLIKRLPTANFATIVISILTLTILLLCKNLFEPFLQRKYRLRSIALPIDIVCIIVLTGLSYAFGLNKSFKVEYIPRISAGFENIPTVPRLDLWPQLFTSALLLAFVIYVSTYSLEKMFAAKYGYQVDANQELLALGTANIVSSFFMCYPCSGSLSRSAVQDKVGGKTQLASLLSSVMIVVFIMFLSTYLETLPKCALSCIIIVALTGTMRKFSDLFHYWKLSRWDGALWVSTFTCVILFGVDKGLLYGLILSFALLIYRFTRPIFNLMHNVPHSEIYLARAHKPSKAQAKLDPHSIVTAPGVIVFEFHGPLMFLNVESFKTRFSRRIVRRIEAIEASTLATICARMNSNNNNNSDQATESTTKTTEQLVDLNSNIDSSKIGNCDDDMKIHSVVFDCGRLTYLDGKGVEALVEMATELEKLGSIQLLLASCSELVLGTLVRCKFFDKFTTKQCFVTVHDAVVSATTNHNLVTQDSKLAITVVP